MSTLFDLVSLWGQLILNSISGPKKLLSKERFSEDSAKISINVPVGSNNKALNQRRQHLGLVVVHHVAGVLDAGDF